MAKSIKNGNGKDKAQDLPWHDKKVAIFKTLKALKALSSSASRSTTEVAQRAGVSGTDVLHYCHAAQSAGLVSLMEEEGKRGYGVHLTAKGAKLDPLKEQKAQAAQMKSGLALSLKDSSEERTKAEEKGLSLVHYRILKAIETAKKPLSYRGIEAETGYYSILTAQLRKDYEDSLGSMGLVQEEMISEEEGGRKKVHFSITAKGKKKIS